MTYLEREIRALMRIVHLREFERFISLCAGRTGQILNVNALSVECGVDNKTIQSWLSLLEASFIIYLLKPYHSNLNKRLIKSPKLYFYDSGLVCYLLGIRHTQDLLHHPLRGEIFETMVISEALKHFLNQGHQPPICYYRDAVGHEVDLLVHSGDRFFPIEIKSGTTLQTAFWKNLSYLRKLYHQELPAGIIMGDSRSEMQNNTQICGWDTVDKLLAEI
jgi:predicted AAA+ superfamily ATPase